MSSIEDSIEIASAPERVFDLVADLPNMGRYSPENTGGAWLGGATGPAVGARFRGTNANHGHTWSTTVTVVACDRPTDFAFEVTVAFFKVARWSYRIEATTTGCRVTETWLDRRASFAKPMTKFIEKDREGFTRRSIRTTLEALKQAAEAG